MSVSKLFKGVHCDVRVNDRSAEGWMQTEKYMES